MMRMLAATGIAMRAPSRPSSEPPASAAIRHASHGLQPAAISGAEVTKEQNPNVPYTVAEIAREAKRAADAGAAIIHHLNEKPSHS